MDWLSLIQIVGFPAFVLIVVGMALWRVLVFLGERLFNPTNGMLTVIANEHMKFVSDVSSAIDRQTKIVEEMAETVASLSATIKQMAERIDKLDRKLNLNGP